MGQQSPRNQPSIAIRRHEEEYAESEEETPQEDGEAQAEEEAQEGPSQEACALVPPAVDTVWRFHD